MLFLAEMTLRTNHARTHAQGVGFRAKNVIWVLVVILDFGQTLSISVSYYSVYTTPKHAGSPFLSLYVARK